MKRTLVWVLRFLMIAVVMPIAVGTALAWNKGWPDSWRTADWSSSGLLPEAASVPEARVMILAARTGRWKSIFAEHMAIVLKPAGASEWTRYEVVGWGNPVKVVLTVAHLDHMPENCDPQNLRAWCQRCHNRYDAPMRRAGIKARQKAACADADMFPAPLVGDVARGGEG